MFWTTGGSPPPTSARPAASSTEAGNGFRLELESRGVDAALIRELLAELPAEEERGAIDEFLRRRRVPPHLTLDERRRVFQQLLRRGFAAEAIARALRDRGEDE